MRDKGPIPLPCPSLWQVGELAHESLKWENWPCPSLAAILRREDPALLLGSKTELALVVGIVDKPVSRSENRDSVQIPLRPRYKDLSGPTPTSTPLMEFMKGSVLKIQNYSISMTQGNNRVSEKSPSEVPLLTEQQKPESLFQTENSLQ